MDVRARFHLLDTLLCSLLFAPFVVLFWHGSFAVLDDVILRERPMLGPWLLVVAGVAVQTLASCIQTSIAGVVMQQDPETQRISTAIFNFILGFAQILQFRGLNDIYEQFVGVGVYDAISATVTSCVILLGLRLCSQTVDIPFVLGLDSDRDVADVFKYTGYLSTQPGTHSEHVFDALSSIGVMQTFVHLFSIAAWVAVDSGFFKHLPFLAMMTSWFGGFALLLLFWSMANVLRDLSRSYVSDDAGEFFARFLVDLMLIGQGLGVVMMWHGHWVLYDIMAYWFPITIFGKNLTPYVEVTSAFALLFLCNITSSLVRSGITADETRSNISCIGVNVRYFAHYFDENIKEREENELKKLSKSVENNNNNTAEPGSTAVKPVLRRQKSSGSGAPAAANGDALGARSRKGVSLQELVAIDRAKRNAKKKFK